VWLGSGAMIYPLCSSNVRSLALKIAKLRFAR
jgi:hypothetical protein